jgi:hypothetical protein
MSDRINARVKDLGADDFGDHAISLEHQNFALAAVIRNGLRPQSEVDFDAARIVACWNAMAGIDDPATFMDDVREILESVAEHDQMAEFCDFWPDEYFFECEGETHLTIGDIRLARALLSRMGGGE